MCFVVMKNSQIETSKATGFALTSSKISEDPPMALSAKFATEAADTPKSFTKVTGLNIPTEQATANQI